MWTYPLSWHPDFEFWEQNAFECICEHHFWVEYRMKLIVADLTVPQIPAKWSKTRHSRHECFQKSWEFLRASKWKGSVFLINDQKRDTVDIVFSKMSRIFSECRNKRVAFSLQMIENETQSTWFFLKWSKTAAKCYRHTPFPSKSDKKVVKSTIGICRLRTEVITKRWKGQHAYAVVYWPNFRNLFFSRRIPTTFS